MHHMACATTNKNSFLFGMCLDTDNAYIFFYNTGGNQAWTCYLKRRKKIITKKKVE